MPGKPLKNSKTPGTISLGSTPRRTTSREWKRVYAVPLTLLQTGSNPTGRWRKSSCLRAGGRKQWPQQHSRPIWTVEKIRKLQSFYKAFTTIQHHPRQNRRRLTRLIMKHLFLFLATLAGVAVCRAQTPIVAGGGVVNG